jgi:predicted esterase
MHDSMLIQQPSGLAGQLVLLFHGVGANAQNMVPVGQALA